MEVTYYTIHHVGRRIVVNLTLPDLGHPDQPDLYEAIRAEDWRPGLLQCPLGHPMYIQERAGVPVGVHVRHADESECRRHHSNPESDEHKALKERIAQAAVSGGATAEVENRAIHGKRVTDVLVRGGGGFQLGCEVQLSSTTKPTVRKRSNIAYRDGITPLWTFTQRNNKLVEAVPSARIDAMPWHDIVNGAQLPVGGGLRRVVLERCSKRPTVCPVKKHGRCDGWHERFEPVKMVLDDLVVRAANREWVPVKRQTSRSQHWYWVSASDAVSLAGLGSPAVAEKDEKAARLVPRANDPRCFYPAPRSPQETALEPPQAPEIRNAERFQAAVKTVFGPKVTTPCASRGCSRPGSLPRCQLCSHSPTYWRNSPPNEWSWVTEK